MRGKRSIAPEKIRFTTARVVSNRYSIMKAGHGSASPLLDGCRPGWTNTTAPRAFEHLQHGIERRIAEKFLAVAREQRDAVELEGVEAIGDLVERACVRPHRHGGEGAEAPRPARDQLGRIVVAAARQRLRAGMRCRTRRRAAPAR